MPCFMHETMAVLTMRNMKTTKPKQTKHIYVYINIYTHTNTRQLTKHYVAWHTQHHTT